jgi:protein SCO1/2|tara:strand:- start:2386 stop:2970 length:585 start_codon:yes stop_codon:yes gene_type:complete
MKLKTSITIIAGCFVIFLFIMLPIFLSIQDQKDEYVASIKGSPFELKDINRNLITEKSFEGPATALFFGFTNCPDVCPLTLNKINLILEELKKEKKTLKVFFISIDPDRDTPEVMKDYLSSYENKIIGITGEPEKIFVLSKSWNIKSQKIFSEDGNYTVDHSSPILLLKNGKYKNRITHHNDIEESLKIIKKIL